MDNYAVQQEMANDALPDPEMAKRMGPYSRSIVVAVLRADVCRCALYLQMVLKHARCG